MAKNKFNQEGTQITFSKSEVEKFKHNNKHLRWGQAFHQHFKLERVTGQDKSFCDRLYNETNDERAKAMVISRTDQTQ